MQIKISNKLISYNNQPFIIAEAGVNHNGRLDLALKLIDAAKEAGADAIKFQTFKASEVVTSFGEMADYQKKNINKKTSQQAMLKKLELPDDFYDPIIKHCHKKDIIFLSTPHGNFDSVNFLSKLVPAFKFGSGDLTNIPVLKYAAKFNKPMILGTGMATLKEVEQAINCIKSVGNNKIILLHCTTNYPCPVEEVNLNAMKTMQKKFVDILVGYSDHTLGVQVPLMAVLLRASVVEKHFTLDKKMKGPDHKASADPSELKQLVSAIRNIPIILGDGKKRPTPEEIKILSNVRKSVVAARNIVKGQIIKKSDIAIKRPGNGLAPIYYDKIVGSVSKKDFHLDEFITL